jgi:hypothetical protein
MSVQAEETRLQRGKSSSQQQSLPPLSVAPNQVGGVFVVAGWVGICCRRSFPINDQSPVIKPSSPS